MSWFKAHWPAIAAIFAGILPVVVPRLAEIAAAEPKTTVGILCAVIVAAYYSDNYRSQTQKGQQ